MGVQDDARFATTLARGLSVLRAFRTTDDGLSNAEIAQRTGLPKSTVSRLTWTLGALGYLVQSERDDRFRPGPTLVAVGHVAASSLSFLDPAYALMARLAEETGTLVVLAVRDGPRLVLIRTWRPSRVASIWLEVGQPISLRGFSSARAFLAAATPAELVRMLADFPVSPEPPVPDLDAMRSGAQDELLARGFVFNRGGADALAPYNAVSVPFRGRDLAEPVVFTCGALPDAADAARMCAEVGPALAAAVRSLERLTGQPPTPIRKES